MNKVLLSREELEAFDTSFIKSTMLLEWVFLSITLKYRVGQVDVKELGMSNDKNLIVYEKNLGVDIEIGQ